MCLVVLSILSHMCSVFCFIRPGTLSFVIVFVHLLVCLVGVLIFVCFWELYVQCWCQGTYLYMGALCSVHDLVSCPVSCFVLEVVCICLYPACFLSCLYYTSCVSPEYSFPANYPCMYCLLFCFVLAGSLLFVMFCLVSSLACSLFVWIFGFLSLI